MAGKTDAFGNPVGDKLPKGVPSAPPTGGGPVIPTDTGLPNSGTANTGIPQQYDAQRQSGGTTSAPRPSRRSGSGSFATLSIVLLMVIVIAGAAAIVALGLLAN
ncbi:MAG TPA: hypothetical protein VNT22_08350 [Baekduia sp.]|nr:hypothetical protein [Baekduia sp.]